MKKTLALILALVMCIGIFAACGESKEPAKENTDVTDPGTTDPGKTEEPGTTDPGTSTDPGTTEEPKNDNIIIAHFDMTESYTLVIEKPGTVGDERIGVRCGAGKIQAGTYNTSGKKRTASYEFDFASLGLEGHSWEYLGATVEIDVSDENNPKIVNTPVKSTFAVKTADLKFPDELTCELPNGIKVNLPTLNYGILRPNNLLNEGGWFIPGWNDKTTILNAQNNHFVNPNYIQEWAIFTICDYKGKECNMYIHTNLDIAAHAEEIEKEGAATPDEPVADTYLVVANDKWSIIANGRVDMAGGETVSKYNGVAYLKCNYTKEYIVASDIADDYGYVIVVKMSDVAALKAGTLEESKLLLVPQEDNAGTWVGQEVTVEFEANGTPKAIKKTGKSVVGEVTISESNGKYIVKVGDTVYLNGAEASAKLAASAIEYLTHNNTYFVTRNKIRPFADQQTMVDLQVIFGNADFDVTKVGNFYGEFINLNRNMIKVVGYDWDGDKALDAVILNDATCVKVGDGALSANGDLAIQICSSNMGFYKDTWWNGGSVNKDNLVMDSSLTLATGDFVMLMGDHMTQTTTVTLTNTVTGVLSAIDWAKKTLTLSGVEYGIACDGEGPYGMAINETRYNEYNWASLIGSEITVRTDGKYVVATLK